MAHHTPTGQMKMCFPVSAGSCVRPLPAPPFRHLAAVSRQAPLREEENLVSAHLQLHRTRTCIRFQVQYKSLPLKRPPREVVPNCDRAAC